MTKEAILNRQTKLTVWARDNDLNANDWDIIRDCSTAAMDEYAKRQCIELLKFVWNDRIACALFMRKMILENGKCASEEQIHQLFLTNQSKQQ